MTAPAISQKTILRGLIAGSALVILLLSVAASVIVRRSQGIQAAAAASVREHLESARLMDQFQLQLARMSDLLIDLLDEESHRPALRRRAGALRREFEALPRPPDTEDSQNPLWHEMRTGGLAFATAATRFVAAAPGSREALHQELQRQYDGFVSLSRRVERPG